MGGWRKILRPKCLRYVKMGHNGSLGSPFVLGHHLGHIWVNTSIFGNMDSDVIDFGAKLLWKCRGICVAIREKWAINMGKIWANIVGELVRNWGKIGWEIR